MKRIGRIDHIIGVGWPDREQRERTIRRVFDPKHKLDENGTDPPLAGHAETAVQALAKTTQWFVRGELKRAAESLPSEFTTADEAKAKAAAAAATLRGSISVKEVDANSFRRQARDNSVPHIRAEAEEA
jgi:hypothetical protein